MIQNVVRIGGPSVEFGRQIAPSSDLHICQFGDITTKCGLDISRDQVLRLNDPLIAFDDPDFCKTCKDL